MSDLYIDQAEPTMEGIEDLRPFPGEPSFLGTLARAQRTRSLLFAILPLLLLLVALPLLGLLDYSEHSPIRHWCADAHSLINKAPPSSGFCAIDTSTRFGPGRDLLSLIAAIALAISPIVIWRQWSAYEHMLSDLAASGAMRVSDGGTVLNLQVRRANTSIAWLGTKAVYTMLASSVAVAALMALEARYGILHLLAPLDVPSGQWAHDVYRQWWAAAAAHPLGAVTYFLVGSWGVYLVTQQNLVGILIIRSLWRSRETVGFAADPLNADGYYGWGSVRKALAATFLELTLHGVALGAVTLTLPPQAIVGPFLFVVVQWLIMFPLHVSFPIVFVRRRIGEFKRSERERLENMGRSLNETREPERIRDQRAINERLAELRAVPTLPFKKPKDLAIFCASVVADTTACVAILAAVLTRLF